MSDTQETSTPAQEATENTGTDWKAEARKWEARAKENTARIRELEPFEARVRELEESAKSDLDAASKRVTAAETRASEAESRALRFEVAASNGVPADLLVGDTREALEETAQRLLEFRGTRAPYRPTEGYNNDPDSGNERRIFARQLFAPEN